MQGNVMPDAFSPPTKRGRRPLVDIAGVLTAAVDSKGQWIEYELEKNRAKSLQRQLKKYEDIEVISKRSAGDELTRIVYIRAIPMIAPTAFPLTSMRG